MESSKIDFAKIPQTAMNVLASPSEFFREMPKTGGFVEPLVFMVAMGVVAGLLQSILSVLRLQVGAGMAMGLGSVIILPIMIGIFGFVGAAVLFLIWKLMGSQESYETAYRCGAYIGVLTPISVLLPLIPFVGAAASVLLMTFFLVAASVAVHNIPSRKAWLVFGIIGGLLVFFSVERGVCGEKVRAASCRVPEAGGRGGKNDAEADGGPSRRRNSRSRRSNYGYRPRSRCRRVRRKSDKDRRG